ncbi:MAG: tetratricopeptide repeat protein, partial [Bacteroidota bacterium]
EEEYDLNMAMEKLVEAYPNDYRLQMILGAFYMYRQQAEKSLPFLRAAAEKGELPGAFNMLGYAYMSQGDMDMAQSHFEAYMKAAPDHYNPHDSMGDFYMASKKYKEAAEQFDMAAELNPDIPLHAEKAKKAREMMNP